MFKYKGITLNGETIYGNLTLPQNIRQYKSGTVWLGIGDEYSTNWREIVPDSFQEFTGKYDIHNKPIYENDEVLLITDCLTATTSKILWDNYTNKFILKNPSFTFDFNTNFDYELV